MSSSPTYTSKAAATRTRILETAAFLFWRRSYHAVAMDELADKTRVNKATIYRYFPDKASLALEVARLNGSQVQSGVFDPIFEQYSGAEDRLAAVYRCMHAKLATLHREEGDLFGCPIAGLALELSREMPGVRTESAAIFDAIQARFLEIALDAIDSGKVTGWSAEALSRTLLQILHGAFVSTRLAAHPEPFLDAANASLTLIGSIKRLTSPSGEE